MPDENNRHGEFAKDGWRYRQAYFMDHDGKYYDLTLSVAYGRNGKIAYNIANIKERSLPQVRGSSNPKTGAQGGKASLGKRVPQPAREVKGKSSMRERDEDLQKKYPKLDLNEDISELDGVPAVELTDGSVLPILDRDRYPTHVSFIEGNRIDVDDLRSGGWIGDGVYDPSFTSDTARYIERKQAGKRVAELRGVPFNQFEDDGKSSMRDNTTDDTAAERKGRQESYANLRAENAKLREQLDYWKGQTKLTKEKTVRKTDADAYAKRLTEQALPAARLGLSHEGDGDHRPAGRDGAEPVALSRSCGGCRYWTGRYTRRYCVRGRRSRRASRSTSRSIFAPATAVSRSRSTSPIWWDSM